jgi:dipeptidyl aminopeptidase/acylaminoacyl peptidase
MGNRTWLAVLGVVTCWAASAHGQAGRGQPPMDSVRARQLYISRRVEDHPNISEANAARDVAARVATDSIYKARSAGVMQFEIVSFKSRVDTTMIPAYVFSPLTKRGPRGHAAMVWVHGYIHGRFDEKFLPFVKEAVQRGYVIITPQYRGSTGYGAAHHNAIDYGGYEIDDALTSYDYLKTLPYVDPDRVGAMGWSHGGFITAHMLFRDDNPFKAGAPIVPVTNLIFRLGDHAPSYSREFATEPRIGGIPSDRNCGEKKDRDCIDIYVERSPVFHVSKLKVPILVHVATNDCDVFFRENQQMVYTLMALKPELADTKIYVDPPFLTVGHPGCGHLFSQRINLTTLERDDSPEQIDAWNRTWSFFAKHLNPDKGR